MAVAIEDGILGLEATHEWTYNARSFTLNEQSVPRARLTKITGLHALPEADDNREPRTGRSGEQLYPSHARGRTVVYEGVLEAVSLQGLRALGNGLRRGFLRRYAEGKMVVEPNPAWGSISHFYGARVIDLAIDDEQERSPQSAYQFGREFTVTLRQADARSYVVGQQSVDGASGATVNCENQGSAPSDPIVKIKGPLSGQNITITRGDGQKLKFLGLSCAAGQTIDVDFYRREAFNNTANINWTGHYSITDSDWWDENQDGLRPEMVETITVTNANFTVKWYHANP